MAHERQMSELEVRPLNAVDVARFHRDGYLVVKRLVAAEQMARLREVALDNLAQMLAPIEYEADVGYPGAPKRRDVAGGDTPRRLLNAMSRSPLVREFATSPSLGAPLRALMKCADVLASQCHHNCFMTKHASFSSRTGWHQDIRYWSFDRPELVSAWVALGEESVDNGALTVLPGSHRLELDRGRFDSAMFLRDDLPENQPLIEQAQHLQLDPADVLFFHCRLFHAASENRTDAVKLALVLTYHAADNHPIPGTRSANYPSLSVK